MVKEYILKGFRYFIYLFACLWITLFISLVSTLISRFFVPKDSIAEYIIGVIIMFISMCVSMFFYSYRRGYSDDMFSLKNVLIPIMLTLLLHLVYARIFSFNICVSGPAFYFSKIIYTLHVGTELVIPDKYIFPFILVFDIFYIIIVVAGEYSGARKRGIDRKRLISGETN